MVNVEIFINRLEVILDYYGLNASSFADKIGVQRSSMSHLLSGRNKPSLDFILKIIEVFPEIDLYWIVNGKGTFPNKEIHFFQNSVASILPQNDALNENTNTKNMEPNVVQNLKQKVKSEENQLNLFSNVALDQKTEVPIDRIVIFYKDGTFKNYVSEKIIF